jgi:hypothetical protein
MLAPSIAGGHALNRACLSLLVSIAVLAGAPLASASDASLEHALKAYEKRLTADIGYLSTFSAPSRGGAGSVLSRLAKIRTDLTGAQSAAIRNQASTSAGRRGRTEVLAALKDALLATGDAQASATAARKGQHSTATHDAGAERREINKAIPLFESGGMALHLF